MSVRTTQLIAPRILLCGQNKEEVAVLCRDLMGEKPRRLMVKKKRDREDEVAQGVNFTSTGRRF